MFLAIDQFNQEYLLRSKFPRKELLKIFSVSKVTKIYIDDKSGKSYHVGYAIKGIYFRLFKLEEFRKLS